MDNWSRKTVVLHYCAGLEILTHFLKVIAVSSFVFGLVFVTMPRSCFSQIEEINGSDSASVSKSQFIKDYYSGKLLNGTVELSSVLPPISKALEKGKKYPTNPIEEYDLVEYWQRFPNWLEGDWHARRGIMSDRSIVRTMGTMRDAQGNVWVLRRMPIIGLTEKYRPNERIVVDYSDQLISSDEQFQERAHLICAEVDSNNLIVRTWQEECLICFRRKKDGVAEWESAHKEFDLFGSCTDQYTLRKKLYRTKEFVPCTDKAIQESFKKFLTSNGLENLLPQALR